MDDAPTAARVDGTPPPGTETPTGSEAPARTEAATGTAGVAPGAAPPSRADAVDAATRAAAVRRACRWVIAGALVLRTFAFGFGFFYWDDYAIGGIATRSPLLSADVLLHVHNGHLMPGGFLLTGILQRLAPLNYWGVLAGLLVLQWLATWLTYRLLLAVFGARRGVVLLVAFAALTPLTLLPAAWWSAAVNLLPMQAATAATAIAALAYERTGRLRWCLLALGSLAVGLAFFEKSVLIPLTVAAVLLTTGPDGERLRAALRRVAVRGRVLWIGTGALLVAYAAAYLSQSADGAHPLDDSTTAFVMAYETIINGVLPALPGGPLAWEAVGSGTAIAAPAGWLVVLAFVATAVVAAAGSWLSPRARWAWAAAGAYLVADLLVLVLGRSGVGAISNVGLSLRYTADALVVLTLALGMTLLPPVGAPLTHRQRAVRAWYRADSRRTRRVQAGVVAVAAAFVLGSMWSHLSLVSALSANASRPWLLNVRQSLAESDGVVTLLDAPAPVDVYNGIGFPHNQLSWVLAPLSGQLRFVDQIDGLRMIGPSGRIVPATVTGATARPGPDGACGYAVSDAKVGIPLDRELFPWNRTLHLGYLAANDTTMTVRLGNGPQRQVELRRGLHDLLADVVGGGDRLTVGPTAGGVGVCLGTVVVGDLSPAPVTP